MSSDLNEPFNQVRRNINNFFFSLRDAVDRPSRVRPIRSDKDRERYVRAILMIEEARLRFSTRVRYRDEVEEAEWAVAIAGLKEFVKSFTDGNEVDGQILASNFYFRPSGMPEPETANAFRDMFSLPNVGDERQRISIFSALINFNEYLNSVSRNVPYEPQTSFTFENLNKIVPQQQVAPVQFDVVAGRIVVVHRPPITLEPDRNNITSAHEHVCDAGDRLLKDLEKSNCDRRLVESIKNLHDQLKCNANIVRIGLANLACSIMGGQFQSELPNAIAGMLYGYNTSVSLYVAQFPEWNQFTKKAEGVDLSDADIEEVYKAAGEVIGELENNPTLADPEVPKTIAFIRRFLATPGAWPKKAAFAMIRTMENLISSILRHGMSFIEKTFEKSIEAGSTAASKVIVGLLGIALLGATGIGSAAIRAGAPWVSQAAEIVQKQIEKVME